MGLDLKNVNSNELDSKIVNFMNEHGDNWREEFEKQYPDIIIIDDGDLSLFKYGITSNFNDPIVQEARGIIINTRKKVVVCWPFRKFGNYYDSYADKIDWNSAVAYEKIDGSIIKLWYNTITNEWQFSTNGTINAKNAKISDESDLSFMDLIQNAVNYNLINFDSLWKYCTYIFELVSPQKTIVIDYPETKLYYIGVKSSTYNSEGIPDDPIFDIPYMARPNKYDVSSIDDCLELVKKLNLNKSNNISYCSDEGFVVVDKYFNRVKVKSEIYQLLSHIQEDSRKTRHRLIYLILNNKIDIDLMSKYHKKISPMLKYYNFALEELLFKFRKNIRVTKTLHSKYTKDNYSDSEIRKKIAIEFKNDPLKFIVFDTIDNIDKTEDEIIQSIDIDAIITHIPSYTFISKYIV